LKEAHQTVAVAVAVAIAVAGKRKGITTFPGGSLQRLPKQFIITFPNYLKMTC